MVLFELIDPKSNSWHSGCMKIESAPIRAARALLDWSGPQLAEASGVSLATIRRAENGKDHRRLSLGLFGRHLIRPVLRSSRRMARGRGYG